MVSGYFELVKELPTPPIDRAWLIGLSGGIGCGKSEVKKIFIQHAAVVADADQLAREILEPGIPGLQMVVDYFGPKILQEDGNLDRAKLAKIVFSSPQKRQELEKITHPLIAKHAQKILGQAKPGELAVYDVPLLAEQNLANNFDVVIMVGCDLPLRLQRLEQRGLPKEQALARINAQASDEQRRALAHIWIQNNGTLTELQNAVEHCILRLKQALPTLK